MSYELACGVKFFDSYWRSITFPLAVVVGEGRAEAAAVAGRVKAPAVVRVFGRGIGRNRRVIRLQAQSQLRQQENQIQDHRRSHQRNSSGLPLTQL